MNVRFIDTSIMLNLLGVPQHCQNENKVKAEWRQVLDNRETLVMPIATIIETGNHIAHISDGNVRRDITLEFQKYLKKLPIMKHRGNCTVPDLTQRRFGIWRNIWWNIRRITLG